MGAGATTTALARGAPVKLAALGALAAVALETVDLAGDLVELALPDLVELALRKGRRGLTATIHPKK